MAHARPTTLAILHSRLYEHGQENEALLASCKAPGVTTTAAERGALDRAVKALEGFQRDFNSQIAAGAHGATFAAQDEAAYAAAVTAELAARGFEAVEIEEVD